MNKIDPPRQRASAVIAHRGFPTRFPENTLVGFEAAVRAGASLTECDVRLTADGTAVLSHDCDLRRSSGVDRLIGELSVEELASYRAFYPDRFTDAFSNTPFSTLEEFCRWLQHWPHVAAFVEVKTESIGQFGIPAVFEAIGRHLRHVGDQIQLISFDKTFLAYARQHSDWPIGWILRQYDRPRQRQANQLNPNFLFSHVDLLPHGDQHPWPGPWRWGVYTVDDPVEVNNLFQRGIQFVETDNIVGVLRASKS